MLQLREHEGRLVCTAHWPILDSIKSHDWINSYLVSRQKRNALDLHGFVFPSFGSGQPTFQIGGFDLTDAKFLGSVHLACRVIGATLQRSTFNGNVLITSVGGTLDLCEIVANGDLEIHGEPTARVVLRRGTCRGAVSLRQPGRAGTFESLDLSQTVFDHVPTFEPNSLPQDSTFYRARFQAGATRRASEPAHRALRIAFAANSDREMEGLFYALEKRCHRRSLQWWPSWLARIVSCLYDWTSNYGRRYELSLGWLIGVQVAFGLGYSIASERWEFPGDFDSTIATFTIGQVVRPFEPYATRAATSSTYQELFGVAEPSGAWLFWMTVHSIISLTLFALMLLAMRWRFRRE